MSTAPSQDSGGAINPSMMDFGRYRFLKWAAVLAVASLVAYAAILPPIGVRTGGSWVGYILGIIGALLIVWLSWFGVRKRSYNASGAKLQAWLSAHVYLGSALLVVGTLHTGFIFDWNVHTLAYLLMVMVILSGMFGVYTYLRYPTLITNARGRLTTDLIVARLGALDREFAALGRGEARTLGPLLQGVLQEPVVGRTWREQLAGRVRDDQTGAAIKRIEALPHSASEAEALATSKALTLLRRRVDLLGRVRREHQLRAIMKAWLYLHVPLATALLAALTAHIIAVFYW